MNREDEELYTGCLSVEKSGQLIKTFQDAGPDRWSHFPPTVSLELSVLCTEKEPQLLYNEQQDSTAMNIRRRRGKTLQDTKLAASKIWVNEFKTGKLSEVSAPGMSSGAFGNWSRPAEIPPPPTESPVESPPAEEIEFGSFPRDPLSLADRNVPTGETWSIRGGQPQLEEEFESIRDSLAIEFPFELDTFQKEAICNLEMGRSVFVAAHTSAGKTVVAEYAFALATRHCTRAVYTSPIKTISNQKFNDFSSKFDVGIMTGDTQINPHASCLILTTEILRSMLYKGADVTRDMEFVIFDEVHYVNDIERGVVWEETIIMLPSHVQVILLSATIPNVDEFAAWVGRTRKSKIYVSGTNKRPVPLQHNLYYGGKLFKICDGDQFLPDGFSSAKKDVKQKGPVKATPQAKKDSKNTSKTHGKNPSDKSQGSLLHFMKKETGPNSISSGQSRSQQTQVKSLLSTLEKKGLLPAVVFVFSKKLCDEAAYSLGSLDLSTSTEAHESHGFIERSLMRLGEPDRCVPQILQMKDWLKRGIGVHHAGLLPIVKEIVEMLFCKGLLKVLFATETFAMGVNAPARSVIFQSLWKHDGQHFRQLLPGEYTQMAGRAGRRGIDDVGTVVIACWDELPDETSLRMLIKGRGALLSSRFRLTYSMMMNLMRLDDLKIEDMLKRSFAEFHAQKSIGGYIVQIEKLENDLKEWREKEWSESPRNCTREAVEDYYRTIQFLKDLNKDFMSMMMENSKVQKALVNGRVVLVMDQESDLVELGVLLINNNSNSKSQTKKSTTSTSWKVLCLHISGPWDAHIRDKTLARAQDGLNGVGLKGKKLVKSKWDLEDEDLQEMQLPVCDKAGDFCFKIFEMTSLQLIHLVQDRLHISPTEILCKGNHESIQKALIELDGVRQKGLSFVEMKMPNNVDTLSRFQERQGLVEQLISHPVHDCKSFPIKYSQIHNEQGIQQTLKELRHRISDAALKQMPEFEQRLRVLEHFGYVAESGTVQLKQRVACEINSGDELVITEMIFHGILSQLQPEEAVAVLSAFVFQEKNQDIGNLNPALQEACDRLRVLCLECGVYQFDCGLSLDPESYCTSTINFGLVEVVFEWAKGTAFVEICKLTSVPEGTIVRTIVRLEQSCREVMDAARVMGNTALFQQMQQASTLIKRDVIFAPSLYVTV